MSNQPPLLDEGSIFLTVWDDAWAAITKPRYYVKWAVQPFGRSVAYVSILLTVMALVTSIYTVLTLRPDWLRARVWIEEQVPPLTMKDGTLSIEGDQTFSFSDNSDIFIRVDTTDRLSDVAIDPFYRFGLIVTADGLLMRSEHETTAKTYNELNLEPFSADGKTIAAALGRWLTILAVVCPFMVFAGLFLGNMIYVGLFSLFVSLISGFRLPIRSLWSMGLYALTPSLLASYITFIVYPLPLVSTLVFVTYMVMAVTNYRRFLDIKDRVS